MKDFLDTCILFTAFDTRDVHYEEVCIFLENQDDFLISIYQEKEEIPKLFLRKQRFFMEAIKFSKNRGHITDYSIFTDKEKIILKKLRHQIVSGLETEEGLMKKQREILLIRKKINEFIQTRISKKVIPIEKINPTLVSLIVKENKNKADARIISSAIQEHQENKLIAFTLDKNDWKIIPIKKKIEDLKFRCPEVRFLR